MVFLQLALENIPLDRIGLKDWICSLVQDGVVEITRDREGNRWLQMNVNWEPNREWITQVEGRWHIRMDGRARAGSMFEQAVERLEPTLAEFGNRASILARIGQAIRELVPAIQRWLKKFGKEREKRPNDEWTNPFSLELRPPWKKREPYTFVSHYNKEFRPEN